MRFDSLGLPIEVGASDMADSSRLAGIMALIGYYPNGPFDLSKYVVNNKYVRHPLERKFDFSRDQTLCLVAGLKAQGLDHLVDLDYVDGRDIFSPAHRGHIKRCQGKSANWLEDAWLWFDIYRKAWTKPLSEPNQLICMLVIAGPKYLKAWCNANKQWQESVNLYWRDSFRQEPELAQAIINFIQEKIK